MQRQLPYQQEDIMECDMRDVYDEQAVPYLVPEFQQSYYSNEIKEFNRRRLNIDGKDRSIILDFICHYHAKFNLANETFENAIQLFDNIVKNNIVRRCDLCMIAMACLLLAAKNEQTYIVNLKYFIAALQHPNQNYAPFLCRYVCCDLCQYNGLQGDTMPRTIRIDDTQTTLTNDNDYNELNRFYYTQIQEQTTCSQCIRKALCNTELLCLQLLNFKVSYTIPLNFLRRYITILNLQDRDKYITFYLAELLMLDDQASQSLLPSQMAVAAIIMEQRLTRKEPWPKQLQLYSCFGINQNEQNIPEQIKDLTRKMSDVLRRLAQNNRIQYFRRRYSAPRYFEVSTKIEQLVNRVNN